MLRKIIICSFILTGFIAIPLQAHAETFKCTTKTHSQTTIDGSLVSANSNLYIGASFTVDVTTGIWTGSPANNLNVPNRKVQIVDPGNPGMSITIITTRGGSIGRLADFLVIKAWEENIEKPFNYYDANYGYFTGTCKRL